MQSPSGRPPENPQDRTTWVVLVPSYRYIEPECEKALRELERRGIKVERRFGHSAIDRARSIMASWAFWSGFQQILWIDSDIGFRPADAEKLLASPHPFCCGLYAIKNESGTIAANPEQGLCGFGFTKTHSSIYELMRHDLPLCQQTSSSESQMIPFFQPRWWPHPLREKPIYYGEDYSFCLHAKQLGFKLEVDESIKLSHIGPYKYRVIGGSPMTGVGRVGKIGVE